MELFNGLMFPKKIISFLSERLFNLYNQLDDEDGKKFLKFFNGEIVGNNGTNVENFGNDGDISTSVETVENDRGESMKKNIVSCTICHKDFSWKHDVKRHMKNIHNVSTNVETVENDGGKSIKKMLLLVLVQYVTKISVGKMILKDI